MDELIAFMAARLPARWQQAGLPGVEAVILNQVLFVIIVACIAMLTGIFVGLKARR